jgi:hypothetical protein
MITKEKHPMRVLFFRDHEISGLRPAAAPSPVSRPGGTGKDLSAQTLQGENVTAKADAGQAASRPTIMAAAPSVPR